ncbi:DUF2934 domain-containing protein [Vreelandella populi]|uniref:DUF2934 domain-containing protein n=1 Tax=Vreelandella populi TaxID=2498858 RepID=A0A3S1E9J9_9GAMM|nr:DUF2934 domain-containing protein [Halomonas populi]RUR37775.1 DUF2934 domain-containing protein [Halomonas populi]RUR48684.1 DUF2934 domain-containing protein [Halomonas populi]
MTDEERVRQLAYSIWEAEGRPEGQQQQHWDRATKIVAAEQAAGNEAELDEVGEPLDEAPILEDDLPLEEDEMGIQESRLPLEDPNGDPSFDEAPFRDDMSVGQDVPVQDRGHPPQEPTPDEAVGSMEPMPEESATVKRAQRPRRSSEALTATDEADAPQPAKKSTPAQPKKTPGSGKSQSSKTVTKKTTTKAKKPSERK